MKYNRKIEDERIEFLKNNYATKSWEYLIEKLGVTMNAIIHRANKLGLKRRKEFTKDEINFMANNYNTMSQKEIGKILRKTESSINSKMGRMKFLKNKKWTENDLKILSENYPFFTTRYIQKKYFPNSSIHDIETIAMKNNIYKNENRTNKQYEPNEMIIQLYELSIKLGRTPLGEDLIKYGLPSSTTYRRYFGSYANACDKAGIITNSNLFGKSIHCRSINNDLCLSGAEKIITDFFIVNDIQYRKEEKYSKYIDDDRCGGKVVDWIIGENIFVEYFGLPEKEEYQKKMIEKRMICRDCNIILIELYRNDLNKLHIIFKDFIN